MKVDKYEENDESSSYTFFEM